MKHSRRQRDKNKKPKDRFELHDGGVNAFAEAVCKIGLSLGIDVEKIVNESLRRQKIALEKDSENLSEM